MIKSGNKPKVLFLCYPYAEHDGVTIEENIEKVRVFCTILKDSYVLIPVHLFLQQYISEEDDRELALAHGNALLERCDELWVLSSRISSGMKCEIELANNRGIPVLYMEDILERVK